MIMKWLQILIIVVFFIPIGCGFFNSEQFPYKDHAIELAWPQPPEDPRIIFLRDIKGPSDIIPDKGRLQKLMDFMTGENLQQIDMVTPYSITTDGAGVLYIADTASGVVHKYDTVRREVDYILEAGKDRLASPAGVAVDSGGNVFISDSVNAKLYKFDQKSRFLAELKPSPEFQRPGGIAIGTNGDVYVVDVLAHKLYVFDKNDKFKREFPRIKVGEELNYPTHVTVDRADNVYVTDGMNFSIKVYNSEGDLVKTIGEIGDAPGSFARPKGVAIDSDHHLYVVDASHNNFQIFGQEGQLLLFVGRAGTNPGEFSLPSGICVDSADRIYVADTYNHRIQVFQYLKEGNKK